MRLELITVAVLAGGALTLAPETRGADAQPAPPVAQPAAANPTALVDGEVRRVDPRSGTITLKHGPIPSLGMPAMSMVFQAKDPAMLGKVKAGDRIKFAADKIGEQYTVTRIERVE
jgi:Cu/Ag efflux protein CusF